MGDMFSKKTGLVTGAASPVGLGRAIAKTIAAEGGNVVVIDLDKDAAENAAKEIAAEYGVEAIGLACNVTVEADCNEVAKVVKEKFGGLDFLVNNAGLLKDNLLMRMSEADFDAVMDVNLKGVFLMTKACSRLILKSSSGRIVNISSVSGLVGQPGQANYSSSKAGVIALTKVTAREFAGKGVLVNAICPGFILTDMTKVLPDQVKEKLTDPSVIPLGRAGSQQDIANAVKFYLSDMSSYITGTVLRVDGGAATGM